MSKHRPEFGEFFRTYDTEHGKRMEIRFPSDSKEGDYHSLHVNEDGTRAVCDCFPFRVRKSCYLTEHALEAITEAYRRYYAALDLDTLEAEDGAMLATVGHGIWTAGDRVRYAALGDAIAEKLTT